MVWYSTRTAAGVCEAVTTPCLYLNARRPAAVTWKRARYVAALQAADNHDMSPLWAFARSWRAYGLDRLDFIAEKMAEERPAVGQVWGIVTSRVAEAYGRLVGHDFVGQYLMRCVAGMESGAF